MGGVGRWIVVTPPDIAILGDIAETYQRDDAGDGRLLR
jgi:hypothetical protein